MLYTLQLFEPPKTEGHFLVSSLNIGASLIAQAVKDLALAMQ